MTLNRKKASTARSIISLGVLSFVMAACSSAEKGPIKPYIGDKAGLPVTGSWYSEFKSDANIGINHYSAFLAATLAQQNDQQSNAAEYFLDAYKGAPKSGFIGDRAFSQLLFAGRMDEAAEVAGRIIELPEYEADDLVKLTHILAAFKKREWQDARLRLDTDLQTGFGFLLKPLLNAWSFAAERNLEKVNEILAPLKANSQLRSIALEHEAFMLDYMRQYELAEEKYRALIAANTLSSVDPITAYAHMLFENGKKVEARSVFTEQIKRFKGAPILVQASARIMQGKAPLQNPATPNGAMGIVFTRLAREFTQAQSRRAAIIYLRLASYMTPDVPVLYFTLGELFEQLQNPLSAAEIYASISGGRGFSLAAKNRRATALDRGGETTQAVALINDLLEEQPNNRQLKMQLGDIARRNSDFALAVQHYSEVIDRIRKPSRNDWVLYLARAISYQNLGDWERAEADMKFALTLDPNQPDLLNNLGYSWIERGENITEAKAMIEKAVLARPNDGQITDSLGWVHYLTGDYERAVSELEKAVKLAPTDSTISEHLGDAYWRVGRRVEARFQWRHALDNGPDADKQHVIEDKLAFGLASGQL
ncbi:tetratricopeptide repeat protein [Kordiimonas sp. SCSIO 12610]|uniref:tetratricopeptide repeat protein n=1 Tax=Kordiimonas sp. SCSIO 12610 TaxID=2829597 RepID=UPI00210BEDC6|nr:tetratricopeptide repeat protein [Kordiimonas sp. SCSIO 12610]UTW56485.1 tetratricopeptide repeat protein [Kordiimonas sp. SCSIO 12610]